MHFRTLSLLFFLFLQYVLAERVIRSSHQGKVLGRQLDGDLTFCYEEGSICAVSIDLFDRCGTWTGDQNTKCVCGNGYVTSETDCYWCQLAYNLDLSWDGPFLSAECTSVGATIAPLPSSVLAQQASYNSSYTWLISGASAASTSSPGSVSAASTGSAQLTVTSKTSPSAPRTTEVSSNHTANSNTYNGGVTSVVSLNGGNTAIPTPSNTGSSESTATTTAKASSSSGAANGLNIGMAVMFTTVAFGLSLLCLL